MGLPVAEDGEQLEFVVVLGTRGSGVDEEHLVLPGIGKGLTVQFEDAEVGVGETLAIVCWLILVLLVALQVRRDVVPLTQRKNRHTENARICPKEECTTDPGTTCPPLNTTA